MRKICSVCHQSYVLSVEEEELEEAGFLENKICDDCYRETESDINDMSEEDNSRIDNI